MAKSVTAPLATAEVRGMYLTLALLPTRALLPSFKDHKPIRQ